MCSPIIATNTMCLVETILLVIFLHISNARQNQWNSIHDYQRLCAWSFDLCEPFHHQFECQSSCWMKRHTFNQAFFSLFLHVMDVEVRKKGSSVFRFPAIPTIGWKMKIDDPTGSHGDSVPSSRENWCCLNAQKVAHLLLIYVNT